VPFPAHNVPLPNPERLRGSWVAHMIRLHYVSSPGTTDKLCGKCGVCVPPCFLYFPVPCLSILTVQLFLTQIAADFSNRVIGKQTTFGPAFL
jgi:hypothetical protein